MHQYKGKLIVHTGSMFSGKTSSLEKDINRFSIAKYNTVAFKPSMDSRYKGSDIKTHDNTTTKGVLVEDIYEIMDYCSKYNPEVVGIDEAQFLKGDLKDIINGINSLLNNDVTVIIAGLDMDFEGKAFEVMKELLPIADYLYKHHAVCVKCGTDAWVSHRKGKDRDRVVIGADDEYEPLCRKCYVGARKKEEDIVNKNQVYFYIE